MGDYSQNGVTKEMVMLQETMILQEAMILLETSDIT